MTGASRQGNLGRPILTKTRRPFLPRCERNWVEPQRFDHLGIAELFRIYGSIAPQVAPCRKMRHFLPNRDDTLLRFRMN